MAARDRIAFPPPSATFPRRGTGILPTKAAASRLRHPRLWVERLGSAAGGAVEMGAELAEGAGEDLLDVGQGEVGGGGDLGAGEVGAEAEGDDLAVAGGEGGERRGQGRIDAEVRGGQLAAELLLRDRVERLLGRGGAVAAVVVDQQVAGDRDQPDAQGRARRVEARPGPQGPLERLLRQVLRVAPARDPVGEEAEDVPDLLVVRVGEVAVHRAGMVVAGRVARLGAWGKRLSGDLLTLRQLFGFSGVAP